MENPTANKFAGVLLRPIAIKTASVGGIGRINNRRIQKPAFKIKKLFDKNLCFECEQPGYKKKDCLNLAKPKLQ